MSKFTERVDRYLEGLEHVSTGDCPGCVDCGLEDVTDANDCIDRIEIASEGSFSWSPCECCDSSLGGDRHPAHAVNPEGDILHLDVCQDCLMYLANGEEPEEGE